MLVPKVSNTSDTYSVSIAYSDAAGSDPCTTGGSSPGPAVTPTSAVLTSTGTTAGGTPRVKTVVMQETMVIDATSTLLGAFTYAMFSQKTFTLQNGLTVNQSPAGAPGNVYGGTLNDCQNSSLVDGSVQVESTLTATLTIGNKCEITGDLYVNGSVILNNTAQVDGSIHAYGGDVTLNNSTSVGKDIYASAIATVGGTINIDTKLLNPIVGGSLYAATAVTATIGGVVQDVITQLPLSGVAGVGGTYAVNFKVASSSMPAAPCAYSGTQTSCQTFPQLNPTAITLAASVGDAAGNLYNVVTITGSVQPDCTNAFVTAAETTTYTTPTAIYAPNCVVSIGGTNTFNLPNNEIWVVAGFSENGGLTVQSGVTGKTIDLSVVVPIGSACPAGDINLKGNAFTDSVKVALYTPCNVNLTGDQFIDGQILAGGNVTTTGNFTLNFDQSASTYLPGTQGAPVLALLVTGKTVTNG